MKQKNVLIPLNIVKIDSFRKKRPFLNNFLNASKKYFLFGIVIAWAIGIAVIFFNGRRISLPLSYNNQAESVKAGILPKHQEKIPPEGETFPVLERNKTIPGKPTQFVVMAFDGSYSLDMWQKTLDFALAMDRHNKSVHFTYFLSGVYFLNYRKANRYEPPKQPHGASLIGFAESNADVEKRMAFVNRAIAEHHEIGSHANGHFSGANWTAADWRQELNEFSKLIFLAAKNNDVSDMDVGRFTLSIKPIDIIGFRAPNLEKNEALYSVLKEQGYLYDTSGEAKFNAWPQKMQNGLWEFPLAVIPYANTKKNLLSMDYNFYYKQSKAKDLAKKDSELWSRFYDDTYISYLNYFNSNYAGNRAPVFIGSHFSEWNNGVYWEALRQFAEDVCGQTEVKCVSYKELMEYLDANGGEAQR